MDIQWAKLLIVVGMPGSGKSTYLQRLKDDGKIVEFYDDYQGRSHDNRPEPELSKCYTPLLAHLKKGETVAASDIRWCKEPDLHLFVAAVLRVAPEAEIEYHYFQNDPKQCKANVRRRAREGHVEHELGMIDDYSKKYKIPVVKTLEVYKEKK